MSLYVDDAADELSSSPQSATLRAAGRLDSGLHHQRRQSASERIDQILEVGQGCASYMGWNWD